MSLFESRFFFRAVRGAGGSDCLQLRIGGHESRSPGAQLMRTSKRDHRENRLFVFVFLIRGVVGFVLMNVFGIFWCCSVLDPGAATTSQSFVTVPRVGKNHQCVSKIKINPHVPGSPVAVLMKEVTCSNSI